jgi:hypothetical protein
MRASPAANGPASWRGRASLFTLAVLVPLGASTCALNQQGVPPPLDRISFPASAYADPDGRWLYVANSNADLRFNNGTLVALDLDAAAADRSAKWQVCPGADYVRADSDPAPCCWDYLDHSILDCDERKYIPQDSTIEIGSFSAGMAFQAFTEPKCPVVPNPPLPNLATPDAINEAMPQDRHDCNTHCPGDSLDGRLFIGVRGDSSLTYVDTTRVADPMLGTRPLFSTCPDLGPISACRVSSMPGPVGLATTESTPAVTPVPDEPYALALNASQDLLYIGHLRGDVNHPNTGGISLFDVSRATSELSPKVNVPVYIGSSGGLFPADGNGNFGVTSLTLRGDQVYASSRYTASAVNVIPSLDALNATSCTSPQDPATITLSPGSDVYLSPLVGAEIRGIEFLANNRAFVLQRTPPALVGFDMSNADTVFPNFPSDILETCTSPTFLQSYDTGEGMRLYVTCFDAGQIYVFDPSVPRLVTVIDSGRGPAGLAFAPRVQNPKAPVGQQLAFIVGFTLNDIAVLDLTPGSDTQYHVIQRFGFPSLVPR